MGTVLSPPPVGVPTNRTITATAPLTIDGGTSADLSVNRTIATAAAGLVANSGLANMPANTIKGNNTGSPATPLDLTVAQVKTALAFVAIASSGSAADLSTGTIPAARMPAHTGDVTSTVGTVATTIGTNVVTNAQLAQMPANTIKLNNTGSTANAIDGTVAQLLALLQINVGGFGDGSDGAAVFDGVGAVTGYTLSGTVYTAQRETAFTNATFSNGVSLDQTLGGTITGFRLFIAGTATVISGTATIKYNGNPGVGQTGGVGLGSNPQGNTSASGAGSIQNAGQVGTSASNWSFHIKGGVGGAGGASPTNVSGAGGTVTTTYTASLGDILTWQQGLLSRINLSNPGIISGGAGGGSGAGTVGVAAGGSGGGGAGVGVVGIAKVASTGTLVIEARGGAGGPGIAGAGSNTAGGGGGGGGVLFIGFGGSSQPSNLTLQCPGGAPGTPQGTGGAGIVGGAGTVKFYPLGTM